jgi:hypothetical protein
MAYSGERSTAVAYTRIGLRPMESEDCEGQDECMSEIKP